MNFNFDPNNQEGSNFDPIPAGEYTAEVTAASIGQPRSGDGQMLTLTWKIADGDYEGRQIWQSLCFQHSNEQAQDIARRQIKDLCVALGITEQVTDPEVFLFKPVKVKVGISVDPYGQFNDRNKITRIKSVNGSDGGPNDSGPKEARAPAPKPATQGPGAAPWKRSA